MDVEVSISIDLITANAFQNNAVDARCMPRTWCEHTLSSLAQKLSTAERLNRAIDR
jgi:hypothetical protein